MLHKIAECSEQGKHGKTLKDFSHWDAVDSGFGENMPTTMSREHDQFQLLLF